MIRMFKKNSKSKGLICINSASFIEELILHSKVETEVIATESNINQGIIMKLKYTDCYKASE